MRRLAFILTFIAMAGATGPAGAERLVVSLSNHRVAVTSNFVGEELVLFGTIEPDPATALLHPPYDLVVTVSGPRQTLRTRRKQRMAGIWVNVDSREFVGVPTYLAVLSNRPVTEIAREDTLRRLQIGLDNFLLPQRIGSDLADTVRDDPFRSAFVRLQIQQELIGVRHRRDIPHAHGVPCRNSNACGRFDRQLPGRCPIVLRRHAGRTHQFGAGSNQDRL